MKNIETLLSSNIFNEVNCLNIANWDMVDFVHFFAIIWYIYWADLVYIELIFIENV